MRLLGPARMRLQIPTPDLASTPGCGFQNALTAGRHICGQLLVIAAATLCGAIAPVADLSSELFAISPGSLGAIYEFDKLGVRFWSCLLARHASTTLGRESRPRRAKIQEGRAASRTPRTLPTTWPRSNLRDARARR